MGSKGQAFVLPSYDQIPLSEHSQTLKRVLEVCQSQQERLALLEETVAQLTNPRQSRGFVYEPPKAV
jgi:hypothetical protein